MLQVTIKTDPPERDELGPADIRAALVDSVNSIAEAARLHVTEALPVHLDRPTPFTMKAIGVKKARPGTRDVEAEVDVLPLQARYLALEIFGGVRKAGDYATTKLGPLIPGKDSPRNAYGNMSRGYVQRVMQQPGVRWVKLRPDKPPVLIRRRNGKTQILALIIEEARYKPRLPFYDLVEEALSGAPGIVSRRLDGLGS
ncbi:hypothetical protein [Methylobacterium sp. Leaf91]|uniref:hypothetical protein n=1 Tax=Methylobacterium sp. Leaf91 TaxID=1736247 RepID=UPI0006F83A95|nr:hypothetical protein [Methylobacterium sp. Leaf91]KQO85932.1 hypothetical protein ASF32_09605 [Methylobacterium sp. Leaf91]